MGKFYWCKQHDSMQCGISEKRETGRTKPDEAFMRPPFPLLAEGITVCQPFNDRLTTVRRASDSYATLVSRPSNGNKKSIRGGTGAAPSGNSRGKAEKEAYDCIRNGVRMETPPSYHPVTHYRPARAAFRKG